MKREWIYYTGDHGTPLSITDCTGVIRVYLEYSFILIFYSNATAPNAYSQIRPYFDKHQSLVIMRAIRDMQCCHYLPLITNNNNTGIERRQS